MLRLPGYKPEGVWVRMGSKSAEDGLERRGILLAETEESRSMKGTRKVVAGPILSRRAGRLGLSTISKHDECRDLSPGA